MPRLTRRAFMESAAAVAASGALAPSTSVAAPPAGRTLTLGVASYSTRKFTLDQTLEMAKTLGVTSMTFKDVHIPRTDSPDATRAAREDRGRGHHHHGWRHHHAAERPGGDPEELRVREGRRLPADLHVARSGRARHDRADGEGVRRQGRHPQPRPGGQSGGRARRTPTRPSSRATAAWACASTSATRCGPARDPVAACRECKDRLATCT